MKFKKGDEVEIIHENLNKDKQGNKNKYISLSSTKREATILEITSRTRENLGTKIWITLKCGIECWVYDKDLRLASQFNSKVKEKFNV